jgi:hypothetical protein
MFWESPILKISCGKTVAGKRDEAHIRISPILKTSVFQNVGVQPPSNFSTHRLRHCRKFNTDKKKLRKCESGITMSLQLYTLRFLSFWRFGINTIPFLLVLRPSFSVADPHPAPSSFCSYLLTWSPLSRPFCLDTWLSTSNTVKSQILIYCICTVSPVDQKTLHHNCHMSLLSW